MKPINLTLNSVLQLTQPDINTLIYISGLLPKDFVVVEIGAWVGHSTICLAATLKEKGGRIYTIDTFKGEGTDLATYVGIDPENILKQNIVKNGYSLDEITVINGRSDDVVDQVPDEIDLLFIDGDHRYSQVCRDIDNYSPKVKGGGCGIICGHDFDRYDYDERYIEQDAERGHHHGVVKAVMERYPHVSRLPSSVWFWVKE